MQYRTPLSQIPSIKKAYLDKLERLQITTVYDLFFHLPHRYEDYSSVVPINELRLDEKQTIIGVVTKVSVNRSFHKKMLITEARVEDSSGSSLKVLWFNQRFIANSLEEGLAVRLSGKVTRDRDGLLMTSPALEKASRDATHTGRLVPVYSETRGLTSRFFRWQLATLFPKVNDFPDPLPDEIRESLHLPTLKQSLAYFHFPKKETEPVLASKRFAFDEMLLVQLKALQMKALFETSKAKSLKLNKALLENFLSKLPFSLTKAQEKALAEILRDLTHTHPMNRLLNGDVGSGKTILAALAALAASSNDTQVAILAPTEVLARQHYENLNKLFGSINESIALFTGSYRILDGKNVTRKTMQTALANGIVRIVVGTHALLQEDIHFQNLSLIVVDEQHRFGVAQRAKLQDITIQTNADSEQTESDEKLLHKELSYAVRGALFTVKKQLGLGHKEAIYQKALAEELKKQNIPFTKEASIDIKYDDKKIGLYRPDFIVDNKIIIELKALPTIGKFEKQQVWHYLKGSSYEVALLANFGHADIEIERFINISLNKSVSSQHKSVKMVPHFLTMTATPIPRTLSLAFFGNLDISILDELPHGRLPIITKLARTESARTKVYQFIDQEITKGHQAFVIFPLVEESLLMKDIKAAIKEHEELTQKIFPHRKVGLIHGKLKAEEKERIMHDFKAKKYDILVATAVIEVGIDIPNATVILIEEAGRFGLAQLHQFRGRVGRSSTQSYCFLFPGSSQGSLDRLKVLERETSGFAIAEADLSLRGPGAFFGTRQSGLPDIAMENLTNMKLISLARDAAQNILQEDPDLRKHPLLHEALTRFEERIHLE
ncbi:MAG: GxxExxY protein [Candidatus Moranbacteria bacterium]|nr:GxxExxY protein [Candidatus Moranbacteria bacterium]